ncbi:energy-coupling factor transporter transmembrane component T family protein [Desulfosarcina ovata]|uniref:Energy-coupling factor transporter transmembrane protein EcfT n=1 Tax=Desulfosarcina ovata subsp. ovata TaxID=2752305 RepID=A0A5K8A9K5_9BACT|nr:energy-coupling factor transporter transmembrane component T [Desulfosarcina ovata]BBO89138.1 hypothetical protein DSCOOX_23180 [Desulfosarcina ovata subsp. ovata]
MIGAFPSARETAVHRLHPFSKMAVGMGVTVYALILVDPVALFILLAFLLCVAGMAGVRISARRWLGLLIFFTIFAALNFSASDDHAHALAYCLRLAVFMAAVPVMAATTAPQEMVRALTRVHLPPGLIVSLLLVWRFFPVMAAEVREMRQAALLRGRRMGGVWMRFYRGSMVPLAFAVVEYSDKIALALEIRGFNPGARRSCYALPRFKRGDAVYLALAAVVCLLAAGIQWGGRP